MRSVEKIAEDMRSLAATVDLPQTRVALSQLEAHITRQPAGPVRVWGAFLGEVIRLASPAEITWVLQDGTAALRAGTTTWFPLDKVEKFARNGAADSIVAFAGVVLGMVEGRTPEQIAAGNAKDAKRAAKAMADGRAFVAAPSVETLCELNGGISHYAWPREVIVATGLRAPLFVPFLAEKARGAGSKRKLPGLHAAAWIATLVEHGIETREAAFALLADASGKEARFHAAYARALVELREQTVGVMFGSKDRAIADGAYAALHAVVGGWFTASEDPRRFPFSVVADVLRAGLVSKNVDDALATVAAWVRHRDHAHDVAPVIDEVLALANTAEKPAQQKAAAGIINLYARAIAKGNGPDDPRIADLVAEKRAKRNA